MRLAVAVCDHPDPEGTSAGRSAWAWCEGIRTLGHDLEAWCWHPDPPRRPLPDWCRWRPVDPGPRARAHLRGILRPRWDTGGGEWTPPDGTIAVADDVPSFAAVAGSSRSVLTVHYRALLDARAVGRLRPAQLQTARGERRGGRRAGLVLAYSERVGRGLGPRPARFIPIGYPVPEEPLPVVDEPVAALLADWSWPPNLSALGILLRCWPEVRDAVPAARLLLAGRHLDRARVGSIPGVDLLGEIPSSRDLLDRAALVAFPCPATSGPKVKVLEALAHGVPVLTTPAGVEGIVLGPGQGAELAGPGEFAGVLAKLLVSPDRRAALGATGRAAVLAAHSPLAVARTRVTALTERFGGSDEP